MGYPRITNIVFDVLQQHANIHITKTQIIKATGYTGTQISSAMSKLVKNPALNIEVIQPGNIWLYRNGQTTPNAVVPSPSSPRVVTAKPVTTTKPQPKIVASPPSTDNANRPIFEFVAALSASEFLIQGEDHVIYKASRLS